MQQKITITPKPVDIDSTIHLIRSERIILDSDLANIYEIPTFRLNEAVKRNRGRFPGDFLFQLTKDEYNSLISQNAMSKNGRGGRRTLPYAFTEHARLDVHERVIAYVLGELKKLMEPPQLPEPKQIRSVFEKRGSNGAGC